jgi:glycosyltransferase involved in cell wall biosynthesis
VSATATSTVPVDIVITNHNYANYLGEALDSALAQTHPAVHAIVVDDGSTDGSRELLERRRSGAEVVLKERGGQASAVNAGLERCRGEVLILLDADDRLHPRTAELAAAAFAADPALSKVQFPMLVVDVDGRPTGARKPDPRLGAPTGDVRRAELASPFDLPWLPGGGTAFRTAAVRRILPIPEGSFPRHGADWYLVHLCALLGTAALLEEPGADYRVHGANGYERDRERLDLGHVRDSVLYAEATARDLAALADELGLRRPRRLLSFADLANRLISLRLDPGRHPRPDDTRFGLLVDAGRALRRRFDVGPLRKLAMFAWFALAAAAPRALVGPLAELMLFPGRRGWLGSFFGGTKTDVGVSA